MIRLPDRGRGRGMGREERRRGERLETGQSEKGDQDEPD